MTYRQLDHRCPDGCGPDEGCENPWHLFPPDRWPPDDAPPIWHDPALGNRVGPPVWLTVAIAVGLGGFWVAVMWAVLR